MPALVTDGLILKRKNFGETDRIVTVLTNRFGKISVIARGVRRITSKRAGNIEVLNLARLRLFKNKGFTLTEAESRKTFDKLKSNLVLSATAFHIIELVDRLVPENQKNDRLFELVLSVLEILEENPRQIFVRAFELKLLKLLGFWGPEAARDLDYQTIYVLTELSERPWDEITGIRLDGEQTLVLKRALRYYIEKVLESPLKSAQVLEKLKA